MHDSQTVTSRPWLRKAAEMWWENQKVTQAEVAKALGLARETVCRGMATEEYEIALREIVSERMPELVPAAWKALKDQWAKGNAQGAVDVLRAFGYLANEKVNLEHSGAVISIQLVPKTDTALAATTPSDAVPQASNGNGGGHR